MMDRHWYLHKEPIYRINIDPNWIIVQDYWIPRINPLVHTFYLKSIEVATILVWNGQVTIASSIESEKIHVHIDDSAGVFYIEKCYIDSLTARCGELKISHTVVGNINAMVRLMNIQLSRITLLRGTILRCCETFSTVGYNEDSCIDPAYYFKNANRVNVPYRQTKVVIFLRRYILYVWRQTIDIRLVRNGYSLQWPWYHRRVFGTLY